MLRRSLLIAVLALVACAAAFAQNEDAKRKEAEQSALSWLRVVDTGKYEQSWDEASSFFKSAVTKAAWNSALQQARGPLGSASHRSSMGSTYQTDLPNAPKGEYVVMQYKTDFAKTGAAIETVSAMLDRDGKWRVAGYFIKPAQ